MGVIGGGIFQAVKGFRNSPSVSVNASTLQEGDWSPVILAGVRLLDNTETTLSSRYSVGAMTSICQSILASHSSNVPSNQNPFPV